MKQILFAVLPSLCWQLVLDLIAFWHLKQPWAKFHFGYQYSFCHRIFPDPLFHIPRSLVPLTIYPHAMPGAKMRLLFKLSRGQLLKSGLGPLARYGTQQETISGRPEQKYLPSDQRLEWPAEDHYLSLYVLVSFKLPVPTDKNLNIILLPRKSEKRCKRETSYKDFVGMKSKFQILFLDL